MIDKTVGQQLDEQLASLQRETASLQEQVTSLQAAFDEHVAGSGEIEPPDPEPPEPPDGEMVDRPYGLDYIPPEFAVPFNPETDVPADAVRWSVSVHENLGDLCAEARERDVALFLDGAHTFDGVDLHSIVLPKAIYGVPGVIIRFTGALTSATPCFGYVVDGDFAMYGIRFEGFGHVIGMCTKSLIRPGEMVLEWDLHGSSRSLYGTQRVIPKGTDPQFNGVGIELDPQKYPTVIGQLGPDIEISDCEFFECEQALNVWSDTVRAGRVDFHRNKASGTYGLVALETTVVGEFYACGNSWMDCIDVREMTLKGNRYHTAFKLAINDGGIDLDMTTQVVQIENNLGRNIVDVAYSDGMSAATFADIRQMTPMWQDGDDPDPLTMRNSVSVSFNELIDLVGTEGQEDANAIYCKARGVTVERNYIRNCGAGWLNESRNGSEVTAICIKDTVDATGCDADLAIIVRGNIVIEAPPHDHPHKGLSVIGTNDINRPVYVIGNQLDECHINADDPNSTEGLIRIYGKTAEVLAIDNAFSDCSTVSGGLIATHNWSTRVAKSESEFSNNKAFSGSAVLYDGDMTLICATGGATMGDTVTGLNLLYNNGEDTFDMLASGGGSGTAVEKKYKPPQVPAGGSM